MSLTNALLKQFEVVEESPKVTGQAYWRHYTCNDCAQIFQATCVHPQFPGEPGILRDRGGITPADDVLRDHILFDCDGRTR